MSTCPTICSANESQITGDLIMIEFETQEDITTNAQENNARQ